MFGDGVVQQRRYAGTNKRNIGGLNPLTCVDQNPTFNGCNNRAGLTPDIFVRILFRVGVSQNQIGGNIGAVIQTRIDLLDGANTGPQFVDGCRVDATHDQLPGYLVDVADAAYGSPQRFNHRIRFGSQPRLYHRILSIQPFRVEHGIGQLRIELASAHRRNTFVQESGNGGIDSRIAGVAVDDIELFQGMIGQDDAFGLIGEGRHFDIAH